MRVQAAVIKRRIRLQNDPPGQLIQADVFLSS
jgi:hypothetical protein